MTVIDAAAVIEAERELAAAHKAVDEALARPRGRTIEQARAQVAEARKLHQRVETATLRLARARFELRKASRK